MFVNEFSEHSQLVCYRHHIVISKKEIIGPEEQGK